METQKIANLLNNSDNESSKLDQENGTLLIIKIMSNMAEEIVITQMHIYL